ncbi:hypothetical protein JB92DRAFT_2833446 [Gautieria morchelliformis]|nr:hypothetical protein JB92DRAFT_2833446 [Gautieria morchelliformis]
MYLFNFKAAWKCCVIKLGDIFTMCLQAATAVVKHLIDMHAPLEILQYALNYFFVMGVLAAIFFSADVLNDVVVDAAPQVHGLVGHGAACVHCGAHHALRLGALVAHSIGQRDAHPEAVCKVPALVAAVFLGGCSPTTAPTPEIDCYFTIFHWIFRWLWVPKSQKIRLLAQALTNEKWQRNHGNVGSHPWVFPLLLR